MSNMTCTSFIRPLQFQNGCCILVHTTSLLIRNKLEPNKTKTMGVFSYGHTRATDALVKISGTGSYLFLKEKCFYELF